MPNPWERLTLCIPQSFSQHPSHLRCLYQGEGSGWVSSWVGGSQGPDPPPHSLYPMPARDSNLKFLGTRQPALCHSGTFRG